MADTERDLLSQLTDDEGFETAIFLSYGVDLAFFETALLSALRSNNCRNHLIFVEAARYKDTLQNLRGSFYWVGSRYVLASVRLPKGLFHPKIALLIGPKQGRLLVGSGNLTFSGYGSNRELFTRLDWTPEVDVYQSVFADAWRFVRKLSSQFCNQQATELILGKAERRAPWLSDPGSEQAPLRFLHNLDQPLFVQIAEHLEHQQVRKATILAPFFNSAQIRAIADSGEADETLYIVQPGRVVGDQEGLKKLAGEEASISLARFQEEDRYVHAKAYVFETDAGSTAITGSPNCSLAALSKTSTDGNIEAAILAFHPDPKHFDPLFTDGIEPILADEIAALSFGEDQPLIHEMRRLVSLLDAVMNGSQISLRFEVASKYDEPLALNALFTGETKSLLPLGEFANGEHTVTIEVGSEFINNNIGPISVLLQHDSDVEEQLDLNCNELWLARLDALRSAAARAIAGGHSAAEALLGLSNDDEKWQSLHKVLSQLLTDELERISKGGPPSGTKKGDGGKGANPEDDKPSEDEVVIIDVEEAIADEETNLKLREDLEEESEFGDFLNLILELIPGKERTGAGKGGDKPTRPKTGKGKPWTMERRIRRRLVGVLRKYKKSLGNPVYLPNLPATAAARDQVVFLLFAHRLYLADILEWDEYKIHLTELLAAFYGMPLTEPPIQSALHEGVLLSSAADIWREKQAPAYMLASLFNLWARTEPSTAISLPNSAIRALAGLAVMFGDLDEIAGDVDSLQSAAERMDIDREALVVGVEDMVDEARPRVIETLEAWLTGALVATAAHDDSPSEEDPLAAYQREKRIHQANIDYRTALFHLYRDEKGSLQRRLDLCEELSFWNRRLGRLDASANWDDRLVDLAEAEGDMAQLADALFELGKQLFFQGEYKLAVSRLRQAETLANRIGLEALACRCAGYIKNARFFLR